MGVVEGCFWTNFGISLFMPITSHCSADIARPKGNERTAGFTPQERASFDEFLKGNGEQSFVDTFRRLYPQATGVYSFWSAMRNSRASNIGWCVLLRVRNKLQKQHFLQ